MQHLREILSKKPDAEQEPGARCIIFTRYKADDREAGAYRLARYLTGRENEDQSESPWKIVNSDWLCDVVTADNREKLTEYQQEDPNELPHVLIVTAGIAEEGLNLPGYNYVINYYISSSVASLEQRFGRVDRLESRHDNIHACYLLTESGRDVSTLNFYIAVTSCLKELLTHLPSRTTIISKEVIEELKRNQKHAKALYERMKALAGEEQLQALAENSAEGCDPELLDFLGWTDSFWDNAGENAPKKRIGILRDMIQTLSWAGIKKISDENLAVYQQYAADMDRMSDGGFYTYHEVPLYAAQKEKYQALRPLDPVKDCAAAIKAGTGGHGGVSYSDYQRTINSEHLALPMLLQKYPTLLDELEGYYVSLFSQGEIDKILSKGSQMGIDMMGSIRRHCFMGPYTLNRDLGVWPDLHKLKKEFREPVKEGALADLSAEECDLLNKNVLVIKRRLPFSLLCDEIASYYRIQDGGALSPAFSQGITQKDSERIYLRMKYFSELSGSGARYKTLLFLVGNGIKPDDTWMRDRWNKLLDKIHRCYRSQK